MLYKAPVPIPTNIQLQILGWNLWDLCSHRKKLYQKFNDYCICKLAKYKWSYWLSAFTTDAPYGRFGFDIIHSRDWIFFSLLQEIIHIFRHIPFNNLCEARGKISVHQHVQPKLFDAVNSHRNVPRNRNDQAAFEVLVGFLRFVSEVISKDQSAIRKLIQN